MAHTQSRTALITGATRGLGFALARALAHEGWHLIINGRDEAALEAARLSLSALTVVTAVQGDVAGAETREALAMAAEAAGGLSVIVNNASTLGMSPQPQLLKCPSSVLETIYYLNVFAPITLLQSCRKSLPKGAVVVNVTSDAAVEAYPGWGGYGSSKATLEHLSAILAVEQPDWRVYWVDPGDMRTQMHQDAFPGEDISDRPLPDTSVPGILTLINGDYPSGRYVARDVDPGGEQ